MSCVIRSASLYLNIFCFARTERMVFESYKAEAVRKDKRRRTTSRKRFKCVSVYFIRVLVLAKMEIFTRFCVPT